MSPTESFYPTGDRQTSEWIAVLAAADVEYHLSHTGDGWIVDVPARQADHARSEIEAYEEDLRTWPAMNDLYPAARPASPPAFAPPWITGLMIVLYMWLGPFNPHNPLLRSAAVDAAAFLHGDWWRPITGLTLHSGPVHLAGNVVCLLLLEYSLCRSVGRGVGWILLLATGIGGNVLACLLHGAGHLSVGASTACFGGLAILAARQALRNLRRAGGFGGIWNRTWVPIGAGLGLLTLLGTGERSDLAAHAFGFACGLVVALPFRVYEADDFPSWVQPLLQLGCILLVAAAWAAAWSAVR